MEKKPILNIMVDLETASTKENAAILSWAMVPFFTDGTEVCDTDAFRLSVSLTSCFLAGMDIDKDTQDWWVNQDPMARWAILGAGEEVKFNINGVIYTRTTNATGHAVLNINLAPGNYTVTTSYNGCGQSNNIDVLPVLSADDLELYSGVSANTVDAIRAICNVDEYQRKIGETKVFGA